MTREEHLDKLEREIDAAAKALREAEVRWNEANRRYDQALGLRPLDHKRFAQTSGVRSNG